MNSVLLKAWKVGSGNSGSNHVQKEIISNCRRPGPLLLFTPKRLQTGFNYEGGGYYTSKLVMPDKPELYTKVEKSYAEWKYVEKLMPLVHVPQAPTDPNVEYPSGWKPPTLNKTNCHLPYFIPRTKNFMMPIYLWIYKPSRGEVRQTKIRNVEGNIWALEKEVGAYLTAKYPDKIIITWVNECWRQVFVRGEFVNELHEWALAKGF